MNPVDRRRRFFSNLGNFDIDHPGPQEPMPLVGGIAVTVVIIDNGEHDSFCAKIVDVCDTSTPTMTGCVPFTPSLIGNTWTANVPVGFLDPFDILEAMKKVLVFGTVDGTGPGTGTVTKSTVFRVVKAGSVNCVGSGSQRPCNNCSAQPVPVCVLLKNVDGAITSDECPECELLNANFRLQHSDDACFSCCWFSDAIPFCGVDEGYWKLEKAGATTWVLLLLLSQPNGPPLEFVRYTASTNAGVCTFPVTLARDNNPPVIEVSNGCTNFPNTITIDNAP
ncbi:MAG: hypothetical protein HYR84_06625 [Planctomycetes bacterium]|nr:hypothetical protein [Planctomycetota bacterium]